MTRKRRFLVCVLRKDRKVPLLQSLLANQLEAAVPFDKLNSYGKTVVNFV